MTHALSNSLTVTQFPFLLITCLRCHNSNKTHWYAYECGHKRCGGLWWCWEGLHAASQWLQWSLFTSRVEYESHISSHITANPQHRESQLVWHIFSAPARSRSHYTLYTFCVQKNTHIHLNLKGLRCLQTGVREAALLLRGPTVHSRARANVLLLLSEKSFYASIFY